MILLVSLFLLIAGLIIAAITGSDQIDVNLYPKPSITKESFWDSFRLAGKGCIIALFGLKILFFLSVGLIVLFVALSKGCGS